MFRIHYQRNSCTFDIVSEEVNFSLKLVATFYYVSFHFICQRISLRHLPKTHRFEWNFLLLTRKNFITNMSVQQLILINKFILRE